VGPALTVAKRAGVAARELALEPGADVLQALGETWSWLVEGDPRWR
jgi:hypothetical protein